MDRAPADRDAFLREACAGDEGLRREVESLLGYEGAADPWIEGPAAAVAAPMLNTSGSSSVLTGRQIGPYQIGALLGAGGMGEVYRAHDSKLGREVAIKILPSRLTEDPERRARFAREARLLATLNHPHIGAIYGLEEGDPSTSSGQAAIQALVLEFIDGPTLADLLADGPLALGDALTLAHQIAEALEAAHEKGIIHRDLKPGNILLQRVSETGSVTSDLRVKVVDFGLAKPFLAAHAGAPTEAASDSFDGTADGRLLGTPAYMSPEQVRGKAATKRSDIWAFGCVLFEMVTGRRAFAGEAATEILVAVLQQQVDWSALPAETPPGVRRLLKRCLEREGSNRLHDIADARLDIEEALAELRAAPSLGPAPVPTPWSRRGPGTRRLIVAGVIALAVAVVTWLLWFHTRPPLDAPTIAPLTALPGAELMPSLSPDGNQVAFAWRGEGRDNWDIYVQQVGTSTPIRLTSHSAGDTAPAWSPDGTRIAFVRGGPQGGPDVVGPENPTVRPQEGEAAIYVTAPLAPNSERKVASYQPVVRAFHRFPTISWFRDSHRLAVVEFDPHTNMNGVVLIALEGGERRRLLWTAVSHGTYHYQTLSPTASALAYALCTGDVGRSCHAYVVELAADFTPNGPPRKLTAENSIARGMTWSGDGRSLIYASSAGLTSRLWRIPLGGAPAERLELAGDRASFPTVSRQGTRLAYSRSTNKAEIRKFDSSGDDIFLPSTLDDRNPQFSPDGKKIVFESRRLGKDSQLWTANSDGTSLAPLNGGERGLAGSPRWSFDSRWIAFDGLTESDRGVFIVDAAGGRPRLLADGGALPSWSADGKWIYFHSGRSGRTEVWRVPSAGGDAVRITNQGGDNPLVSPGGETLYYRKTGSGTLFASPIMGGPEREVLHSILPYIHSYFPVADGIYYLSRPDHNRPTAYEVRFFKFATGDSETLHRFESFGVTSLTVSSDRTTILCTVTSPSAGSDLMLIQNFR